MKMWEILVSEVHFFLHSIFFWKSSNLMISQRGTPMLFCQKSVFLNPSWLRKAVGDQKRSDLIIVQQRQNPEEDPKLQEVYRLKGKKLPPSFDPTKSEWACKCPVCLDWKPKLFQIQKHWFLTKKHTGIPLRNHQIWWFSKKISNEEKKCTSETRISHIFIQKS